LPITLNPRYMDIVTLWTSKDFKNKDTFDIPTVSVHRTKNITRLRGSAKHTPLYQKLHFQNYSRIQRAIAQVGCMWGYHALRACAQLSQDSTSR